MNFVYIIEEEEEREPEYDIEPKGSFEELSVL